MGGPHLRICVCGASLVDLRGSGSTLGLVGGDARGRGGCAVGFEAVEVRVATTTSFNVICECWKASGNGEVGCRGEGVV